MLVGFRVKVSGFGAVPTSRTLSFRTMPSALVPGIDCWCSLFCRPIPVFQWNAREDRMAFRPPYDRPEPKRWRGWAWIIRKRTCYTVHPGPWPWSVWEWNRGDPAGYGNQDRRRWLRLRSECKSPPIQVEGLLMEEEWNSLRTAAATKGLRITVPPAVRWRHHPRNCIRR